MIMMVVVVIVAAACGYSFRGGGRGCGRECVRRGWCVCGRMRTADPSLLCWLVRQEAGGALSQTRTTATGILLRSRQSIHHPSQKPRGPPTKTSAALPQMGSVHHARTQQSKRSLAVLNF